MFLDNIHHFLYSTQLAQYFECHSELVSESVMHQDVFLKTDPELNSG